MFINQSRLVNAPAGEKEGTKSRIIAATCSGGNELNTGSQGLAPICFGVQKEVLPQHFSFPKASLSPR